MSADEPTQPTDAEGWIALFDGQTLKGWQQRGGRASYAVVDGTIVGTSAPDTENTFLCTEDEFTNFELELEFWVDDGLNSGIQIRSHSRPDYQDGRVHGNQVEIDPSPRSYTGGIYDEARAGWLYDLKDHSEAQEAFRPGTWNRLRVLADGTSIRTWLNGVPAADLVADEVETGFIGLQVHGVGSDSHPYQVRWRHIRLRKR